MLIESTDTVQSGGAGAAFGFVGSEQFSSPGVTVRSVLNPGGIALNDDIGVLAHLSPSLTVDDEFNGYAFTIDFGGTAGSFDLSKITDGDATGLATANIDDFNPQGTYVVELTVFGDKLAARVFDTDDNQLGEHTMTDDDPWEGGFAGVVAQRDLSSDTLRASYGLTSAVTAVPEPSSLAALGFIAASAIYLRRRR